MDKFHIVGPTRLTGRVRASGAKNAALPALTASLLTDQPLTLRRVPSVRDIRTMLKLLDHLGITAEKTAEETDGAITLRRERPNPEHDAPYDLVKTMRASVLSLGPLVAKEGHARVSLPGGCAIGVRPIDQHLKALTALGADVRLSHGYVDATASRLAGTRFRFDMATVTGTENVMMAAALARGTTVLDNCAREPEVVDLANLLNAMGARVSGAGEETIVIDGVDELGAAEHTIIPDRIEGGTYLIGAALTRGDVLLEGANPADLAPLLDKLAEIGAVVEVTGEGVRVCADTALRAIDVETAPHPGFPTDLQAQYMTLMTSAHGVSTISETIFENRFQHAPELMRMGADVRVDGGRATIHGPSRLTGAGVMATDLRASACLVLAGVAAEGETVVDRIYHLDRGYERMELKLQNLGARVARWSVPMGS
ncbi:MAG TPA: UDP-N-acetylglucosamine 1-carboxyvinyltransferase [Thermoanaerobaculia bacterium]|jgi:UDP-N-acetylglucosamine 1-carboxyvinyltransferase|nr:UDP-N-acetylglucosamine 1-carboxyvinyltransferase [Thermoanaerobaculia bacterium]